MARGDKGKTQLAFLALIIFALMLGIAVLVTVGHRDQEWHAEDSQRREKPRDCRGCTGGNIP